MNGTCLKTGDNQTIKKIKELPDGSIAINDGIVIHPNGNVEIGKDLEVDGIINPKNYELHSLTLESTINILKDGFYKLDLTQKTIEEWNEFILDIYFDYNSLITFDTTMSIYDDSNMLQFMNKLNGLSNFGFGEERPYISISKEFAIDTNNHYRFSSYIYIAYFNHVAIFLLLYEI